MEFSKILRYLPELDPKRIRKNVERLWKIHVNPPKERNIYLKPERLSVITEKVDVVSTKGQPKQVVYDENNKLAFVSCMSGHSLQVFAVDNDKVKPEDEITFQDQCVEVLLNNGKVLVTTTNFERPPREMRNKLWVLDAKTRKIEASVDTGGNWSKLIAASPTRNEILISNWHSHDISVIDTSDSFNPSLVQILKWGEAPRGIAFTPGGNSAIVTGFYSGNLGILVRNEGSKQWESAYVGKPFDGKNYHGNMRHVLVDKAGKNAVVSNLGRNLVHIWSISQRDFLSSISVGKSPNSIDWVDKNQKEIIVSCRDSNCVYRVDLENKQVIGRSQRVGKEPTGLCSIKGGFLVTGFESNTLELYKYK